MNLTRIHRGVTLPAFTGDPIYTRPVPEPDIPEVDQEAMVLDFIRANPGTRYAVIHHELGINQKPFYRAITALISAGKVCAAQPSGYGGSKHYWLAADSPAHGFKPRSGRGRPRRDAKPATGQKSGVPA